MAQRETRYNRLGELLTKMIRSLHAISGNNMSYTMKYIADKTSFSADMVHRWRQGRSCPPQESLKLLTHMGKEEAHLDREWGEQFLNAARYPETTALVNSIWGPKELRNIPYKLMPLEHTDLIGRQNEMEHLLELLSPRYAAHLITVDGIGGVGKTALVLEAAYRCWRASTGETPHPHVPTFDAIIFVSAKQQHLTPDGIMPRYEAERTLHDIFREVAMTLNRFEITHAPPQDQRARVREALTRQRTLLIVDNLETMEDKQEIISFLYELPPPVKVVITTRERALSFSPVRLEQLTQEKALDLIEKQALKQEVEIPTELAHVLYQHIGGIPAALGYAIGQIASGYSIETVLDRVPKATGDVARFCFEGSIEPLRGRTAHVLLMAIALFPKQPLRMAIAEASGLATDPIAVEEGLAQLRRLSLVSLQESRYIVLPLTREYALAELAAHPQMERETRARWVEWYKNFIQEYGNKDWDEWHIKYDHVEEEWENLLAVFDWCAAHDLYDELVFFWLKGEVGYFSTIYGYWDDRQTWLRWLVEASERRGDWSIAVQAMNGLGFSLMLMGQFKDAHNYLSQAWNLREHIDLGVQANLAQNISNMYYHQDLYPEAKVWLEKARHLLDKAPITDPEKTRRLASFHYDYGGFHFKTHDYDQARECFRETVRLAQTINWQRAIIYAHNSLADIAIVKGQLDDAEDLLQTGLPVSMRNKDKRRTALFRSSFAKLCYKRRRLSEARQWAEEAKDDFERLGMQLEAREMYGLLQTLSNIV